MSRSPDDCPAANKRRLLGWLWTPIRARVVGPYLLTVVAVVVYAFLAVMIWRLTPLAPPRATLPAKLAVLALSPDDRFLVVSQHSEVALWDFNTGGIAARLDREVTPAARCDFSPDGRWLATYDRGMLHLWELPTGSKRLTLRLSDRERFAAAVTFSPDGHLLAFTSDNPKPVVRIWDVEKQEERAALAARTTGLYFSPDGRLVVFETWEPRPNEPALGRVHLWDFAAGKMELLEDKPEPRRYLAFSPDGKKLATAQQSQFLWKGDYEVKLWSLNPPTLERAWKVPRGAGMLRFIPGSNALLVQSRAGADDWEFTVLDTTPRAADGPAHDAATPESLPAVMLAGIASPDGRLLARLLHPAPNPPAILELPGLNERAVLTPLPQGQRLLGGRFSPDGKWLAVHWQKAEKHASNRLEEWLGRLFPKAKSRSEIHLYDTATGQLQQSLPGTHASFTGDSQGLFVHTTDGRLSVWDLPLRRRWGQLFLCWAALLAPLPVVGLWLRRRARLRPVGPQQEKSGRVAETETGRGGEGAI